METLLMAYEMAKKNNGAPGTDGVSFEDIETQGVATFLEQIQEELIGRTYVPLPVRNKGIPKGDGKFRTLSIPAIQDRVAQAIVQNKTRVIDLDLRAYFDTVRHEPLLKKVAQRVNDDDVMHLLKAMLKASGKQGVPQGGVISPVLSNLYLNEVDRMLERAKEVTRYDKYTYVEYARFADDMVILVDVHQRHNWLMKAVEKRLREEFAKLQVEVNEEKSSIVDLSRGENFGFLGFDFRRIRSLRGVWRPHYVPKQKKRTVLLQKLKEFSEGISHNRLIE